MTFASADAPARQQRQTRRARRPPRLARVGGNRRVSGKRRIVAVCPLQGDPQRERFTRIAGIGRKQPPGAARPDRPLSRARFARLLAREHRAAVRRLRDLLAALLRAAAAARILGRLRGEPGAEQPLAVVRHRRAGAGHLRGRLRLRRAQPASPDDALADAVLAVHAGRRLRAALARAAGAARADRHRAGRRAGRGDGLPGRGGASGRAGPGDGALRGRHRDRRDGRSRDHRRAGRAVRLAHRGCGDRRARARRDAGVPRAAAALAAFHAAPRAGLGASSQRAGAAPARPPRAARAVPDGLRADGQLRPRSTTTSAIDCWRRPTR